MQKGETSSMIISSDAATVLGISTSPSWITEIQLGWFDEIIILSFIVPGMGGPLYCTMVFQVDTWWCVVTIE